MKIEQWAFADIDLCWGRLRLRSLEGADVAETAAAICDPDGWFARRYGFDTVAKVEVLLTKLIERRYAGLCHPMVVSCEGQIVGFARFNQVNEAAGSLEIGTWIAKAWQRTFVNSELKYTLLSYCFEQLQAQRVGFDVEVDNMRSIASIERIGARFVEVRRHGQGLSRYYEIDRADWQYLHSHLRFLATDNVAVAVGSH